MENLGLNAAFWRGRRVFLTGHTGFKGSWLGLMLAQLGAKVSGYALAPEPERSLFVSARVERHLRSTFADVRDLRLLTSALAASEAEIVLHLAAQALVLPSYEAPLDTFSTNVMGTANVLEAVRSLPTVRAVLVVTSDKVYSNSEWVWPYREGDALGGRDPYSASKACAELVTAAYRASFLAQGNARVATARAGNVIGGGDWAKNRIVPDFARAALSGGALSVRNPASARPWQHVLDPLEGYLMLAERLASQGERWEGAWNFGPSPESVLPVSKIVADMSAEWHEGARWEHKPVEQPHEACLLTLDSSKARQHLGWRPRLGYARGLSMTVDWYKAFGRGEDLEALSLSQIATFLEQG